MSRLEGSFSRAYTTYVPSASGLQTDVGDDSGLPAAPARRRAREETQEMTIAPGFERAARRRRPPSS